MMCKLQMWCLITVCSNLDADITLALIKLYDSRLFYSEKSVIISAILLACIFLKLLLQVDFCSNFEHTVDKL